MTEFLTQLRKTVRLRMRLEALREKKELDEAHKKVENAPVDPRVTYPSYKSMDDYIDIDRLKSLNGYLAERLKRRDDGHKAFWTGPFTLNLFDNRVPGSKMVELQRSKNATYDYYDLDKADVWEPTEYARELPELMGFIRTLPFKSIGRAIIFYDFSGSPVTAHRDHANLDVAHEFIWFRPNLSKPFYMMNKQTGEKSYVKSYSAWFDTVNQFHGADATPGLSVSLRIDGIFTDELRQRIPKPSVNLASTASFWASVGDRRGDQ
jgi:hypothetical protein